MVKNAKNWVNHAKMRQRSKKNVLENRKKCGKMRKKCEKHFPPCCLLCVLYIVCVVCGVLYVFCFVLCCVCIMHCVRRVGGLSISMLHEHVSMLCVCTFACMCDVHVYVVCCCCSHNLCCCANVASRSKRPSRWEVGKIITINNNKRMRKLDWGMDICAKVVHIHTVR